MTNKEFFENIGVPTVNPRWTIQEALLLFMLLDRKVEGDKISSSKLMELRKRFCIIANLVKSSQLKRKSVGQIRGKFFNMKKYVGIYNRNQIDPTSHTSDTSATSDDSE